MNSENQKSSSSSSSESEEEENRVRQAKILQKRHKVLKQAFGKHKKNAQDLEDQKQKHAQDILAHDEKVTQFAIDKNTIEDQTKKMHESLHTYHNNINTQEQNLQKMQEEHSNNVKIAHAELDEKIQAHKTKEELYDQKVRSISKDLESKKMNQLALADAKEVYHNVAMEKIKKQQKNNYLEQLEHFKNMKDEKINNEISNKSMLSIIHMKTTENEAETEKLREQVYKYKNDVKKLNEEKQQLNQTVRDLKAQRAIHEHAVLIHEKTVEEFAIDKIKQRAIHVHEMLAHEKKIAEFINQLKEKQKIINSFQGYLSIKEQSFQKMHQEHSGDAKIAHAILDKKILDQEQKLQKIEQDHTDNVTQIYTCLDFNIQNNRAETEKLREKLYKYTQDMKNLNKEKEQLKVQVAMHAHNVLAHKKNTTQFNFYKSAITNELEEKQEIVNSFQGYLNLKEQSFQNMYQKHSNDTKIACAIFDKKIRDQEQYLVRMQQQHTDNAGKTYTQLYKKMQEKQELHKQNVADLEIKKMNQLALLDAMENKHKSAMEKVNEEQKDNFLEILDHYEKLKEDKIKHEMTKGSQASILYMKTMEHEEEKEKLRQKAYEHEQNVKNFSAQQKAIIEQLAHHDQDVKDLKESKAEYAWTRLDHRQDVKKFKHAKIKLNESQEKVDSLHGYLTVEEQKLQMKHQEHNKKVKIFHRDIQDKEQKIENQERNLLQKEEEHTYNMGKAYSKLEEKLQDHKEERDLHDQNVEEHEYNQMKLLKETEDHKNNVKEHEDNVEKHEYNVKEHAKMVKDFVKDQLVHTENMGNESNKLNAEKEKYQNAVQKHYKKTRSLEKKISKHSKENAALQRNLEIVAKREAEVELKQQRVNNLQKVVSKNHFKNKKDYTAEKKVSMKHT